MEVIKISPRGYCYGVVDALQLVRQTAKDPSVPRPIYIIGLIVHNRHAIEELTNLGVITLDGPERASILEQVTEGTVIFTAHGVSPLVKRRARERGLNCIDYIKTLYPQAEVHIDICAATQSRQEAVVAQAKGADLTVVVGDPRSNNTNRLVQVSEELAGVPAVRIEDLSQLKPEWLKGKKRVAVTAGASTPSQLTREVIRYLEQYQPER